MLHEQSKQSGHGSRQLVNTWLRNARAKAKARARKRSDRMLHKSLTVKIITINFFEFLS
jgi:hypothetical protein